MKKQPSSKTCFVCGVENIAGLHLHFTEVEPGEVVAEKVIPAQYAGYPGIVHGGILASILDEIAGRAFMHGDPPRFMFTAKLSIRYRKPVPVGQKLVFKGHAGKDYGRVADATGEVLLPDGTLLADAVGTYVDVTDEMIQNVDLESLGWKIYPEEEIV